MANQPDIIPMAWAANNSTADSIPETTTESGKASWDQGFPVETSLPLSQGGVPPKYGDFNGILNILSQFALYAQAGGQYAWNNTLAYGVGSIVLGTDGNIYRAAQASTAVNPVGDASGTWEMLSNLVHKTGNEEITGIKTWTVQSTGPRATNTNKTLTVDMRSSDTPNGGIFDVTNQNWIIGRSGATGGFFIQTKSGSNSKTMEGKPDGTLTWDGKDIITASGGTMTGFLTRNGDLAKSGSASGQIAMYNGSSAADGAGIWLYGKSHSSRPSCIFLQTYTTAYHSLIFNGSAFYPGDNSTDLGLNNSTNRWKNEYFQTNPNVSSDERIKSSISSIPDDVLDAWADVNWSQFQMNDAIEEKGINNARLHTGIVAQRVRDAFSAHDLDATRYGLFCYDEWSEKPEERDEKGEVISEAIPAGNQNSIRYGEALCMEAAYQRRRADRAEARIAALERRLDEMEAVLASLSAPVGDETFAGSEEGEAQA